MSFRVLSLAGSFLLAVTTAAQAEGDPEAGKAAFNQCRACHVIDQEQNRVGPHLVGVFGREAGSVEGFNYSQALKDADIVWNEETLSAYLADPRAYIPGNRMSFAGIKDEQRLSDLIAYLKQAPQQ